VRTLVTTAIGAGVNIVLNLILIPFIGIQGAALATFIAYFGVFIIRAADTRQYIRISYNVKMFGLNFGIIGAQTFLMLSEPRHYLLYQIPLFMLAVVVNIKPFIEKLRGLKVRG